MRNIFFLLSASCAFSHASECQAEETSLLQGRSLVHHKRNKADDALLLQTRADTAAVMKDPNLKRQIHRFRVHVQDDLVSLLQSSHTNEATVYQICADDDSGSGKEVVDSFSTLVDTCGSVTVSNETGEFVANSSMCAAFSVAAGSCFSVVESPDFFDGKDGAVKLATASLQDDVSNTSDVFLIELPDIGESSNSKAMDEIKTKTDQFPGAVVLFHGKQRLGFLDLHAHFVVQQAALEAELEITYQAWEDQFQALEDQFMRQQREAEEAQAQREAEEAQARNRPNPLLTPDYRRRYGTGYYYR